MKSDNNSKECSISFSFINNRENEEDFDFYRNFFNKNENSENSQYGIFQEIVNIPEDSNFFNNSIIDMIENIPEIDNQPNDNKYFEEYINSKSNHSMNKSQNLTEKNLIDDNVERSDQEKDNNFHNNNFMNKSQNLDGKNIIIKNIMKSFQEKNNELNNDNHFDGEINLFESKNFDSIYVNYEKMKESCEENLYGNKLMKDYDHFKNYFKEMNSSDNGKPSTKMGSLKENNEIEQQQRQLNIKNVNQEKNHNIVKKTKKKFFKIIKNHDSECRGKRMIGKKRGREPKKNEYKNKSRRKFDRDNMFKKFKVHFFKSIIIFINKKVKVRIFIIRSIKGDKSKNGRVKFNLELLEKKICEIINENIYYNENKKDKNKNKIKNLMKNPELAKIFNKNFKQCLQHCRSKITEDFEILKNNEIISKTDALFDEDLDGLEMEFINEIKKVLEKNEENPEDKEKEKEVLKEIFFNFEEIYHQIKPRKSRKEQNGE